MAEANLTVAKQLEAMRGSVGDDVFDASLKLVDERRIGLGGRVSVYEAAFAEDDEDEDAVLIAAKARADAGVAKNAAPAAKAAAKTRR